MTKSWRRTFSQHLSFQSLNSNTRAGCERCSRLIKKILARWELIVIAHLLGLKELYTLFECFYGRFSKSKLISGVLLAVFQCWYPHIHNATNHAIGKNSWQSYFKKFEAFFSWKQQGALRADWKIYSCIFYHFCIMVTIFQVTNSLSIFSTTIPSLAQYRNY